jgi:hypothetical protein
VRALSLKDLLDCVPQRFDLVRRHAEVPLPTRPFPRSSGGHQREEDTGVLGREQMQRSPHRPGLDEPTVGEGAADLTGTRGLAPNADGKLCRGRHLRLDRAQAADYADDGGGPDWVQELAPHPPRERLLPTDPQGHWANVPAEGPTAGGASAADLSTLPNSTRSLVGV